MDGAETEVPVKNQLLLVPLKDYLNGKHVLSYYTEIVPIGDPTEDRTNYSVNVSNDVKTVWNWDTGTGAEAKPGPSGEYGSATAQKGFNVKVNLVNKHAVSYDPVNRLQTWEFDVNQSGLDANELIITDTIATQSQIWSSELTGPEGRITLECYDRLTDQKKPGELARDVYRTDNPQAAASSDWYAIETADGSSKLTLHLAGIRKNQYYKFRLQTQVKDWNYAVPDITIRNTAEYTAVLPDNKTVNGTTGAESTISHTLIEKFAVPYQYQGGKSSNYDYQNNTVQWKIRINEEKLPIEQAEIADTLPAGTRFFATGSNAIASLSDADPGFAGVRAVRGTGLTEDGSIASAGAELGIWEGPDASDDASVAGYIVFGNEKIKVTVEETAGSTYHTEKLHFVFPETALQHIYEFTFLTSVDEDYRKVVMKSNDAKTASLKNSAELTGKIEGRDVKASASDTNQTGARQLIKNGTYHALDNNALYTYKYYDENGNLNSRKLGAAYISWNAYVNRTGIRMQNVVITDQLQSFLELVPASMNVYAVSLNSDGSERAEKPEDEDWLIRDGKIVPGKENDIQEFLTEDGRFAFKIPTGSGFAEKTLKITFDTILVDDASANQMTNTLTAEGGGLKDTTGNSRADGASNFRVESYASAKDMYFLRFVKVSDDVMKRLLGGAEFTIQKLQKKAEKSGTLPSDWEPAGPEKIRVSKTNGKVNFTFLLPNTVYKIQETLSPVGYKRSDQIWYLVTSDGNMGPGVLTGVMDPDQVIRLDGSGKAFQSVEVANTPAHTATNSNWLKLKKTGIGQEPLSGVNFALIRNNTLVKTAKTNADGSLSFTALTPLDENRGEYYVLKELSVPEGYENPEGELRVYVTAVRNGALDTEDNYTVRVEFWENGRKVRTLEPDAAGIYQIKNTPIRRNGAFRKVDTAGNLLASDDFQAVFDVYRLGDGGSSEHDIQISVNKNTAGYVPYKLCPAVTAVGGIATLSNWYYGYYKLVERDHEKITAPAAPFYLYVGKNGIFALPQNSLEAKVLAAAGKTKDEVAAQLPYTAYTVNLSNPDGSGLSIVNELKNTKPDDGGHGGNTGGGEDQGGGSGGGGNHGGNTGGGGDHGGNTGDGGDHGGNIGGGDHGGNTGGHGGSSSGGSSGGNESGSSETPGTVTPPTEPAAPVNPEPQPTEPEVPEETIPAERLPQIPILPDGRPDVKPGSSIEFLNPSNSGGEPLYRGSYDPSEDYLDVLNPGEYLMVLMDEDVPLAQLLVMIDDEGIPLAVLPKVGDAGLPKDVLAAALFLSAAGLGTMFLGMEKQRRRRKSA